jgi:hypothetical protein
MQQVQQHVDGQQLCVDVDGHKLDVDGQERHVAIWQGQ